MFKKLAKQVAVVTLSIAMLASFFLPSLAAASDDTGGYPWADAVPIYPASYDWGYVLCQPAMQQAKTCGGHTIIKAGIKYYLSDPWHYDVRNCTSYVAWRVDRDNGQTIAHWGNAQNWIAAARRQGYKIDTTATVGSIAWWKSRLGHVAYVTGVNSDGRVNIDQYNKHGDGKFSHQTGQRADMYIHLPIKARDNVKADPGITTQAVVSKTNSAPAVNSNTTAESNPTTPPKLKLEPLSPLAEQPLASKPGFNFDVAVDPKSNQANVYAVQYKDTNSGVLELSVSNGADGNTTWAQTWSTAQPLPSGDAQQHYLIADANFDDKLDLYILQTEHAQPTTKITVLDGASGFSKMLDEWNTNLTDDPKANYSLVDYDHNGSLDLITVTAKLPQQVDISVLDGSHGYSKTLVDSQKTSTIPADDAHYAVGDHDRDGQPDIYQVAHGPVGRQLQVEVFCPSIKSSQPTSMWSVTTSQ